MQTNFRLYKADMKYIRNLHNTDDKVLSASPQAGKDNRVLIGSVIVYGIHKLGSVIVYGIHKYCIPLLSPKENIKNEEFYGFFQD